MKKIFTFLAVATLVAGCSKTDEALPASTYTITGYSAADTRTEFGEPDANSIPFLWSVGDKVWAGLVQSEALTSGGPSATFTVPGSALQNNADVYYNMMATQASNMSTAVVPTAQDMDNSLGENGDFGYAKVSNGEFTLQHATSYLWFDIKALPANATLRSIRLHAGDAIVAGSATWNGSAFGAVSNGRSIIDLAVNKTSVSDEVLAMVVLPTEIESATVTYELSISGDTQYYEQTLGAKTLENGKTYKISVDLSAVELVDYTIRTLTFEDNHTLFAPYSFRNQVDDEQYNISQWSELVPQLDYFDLMIYTSSYSGVNEYNWTDANNTLIHHQFPVTSRGRHYNAAGHALSRSFTRNYETYGSYNYELYVYEEGAHSGNTFCVHHGYDDFQRQEGLVGFKFNDGVARVIESMYVANTAYAFNTLHAVSGFGADYTISDTSTFKIVAYGYDDINAEDNDYVTFAEFYLLEEGQNFVTEWTKWDLSDLGKVKEVRFNLIGSNDMIGSFGLSVAGYFAYDDIAVRFE